MLTFTPIASGSTGNCYRLENGTDTLILEAGLHIRSIQEGFDFKLSEVAGCLSTHFHADHSKSLGKLMALSVPCYVTRGTADALKLTGHRLHIIEAGKQFAVGSFTVMPFEVEHDCPGAVGFLIASGNDRLLFVTDSYFIRQKFRGLTMIAVECNYDSDIMAANVDAGLYPVAARDRVYGAHMSLATCKEFLQAQDLSKVEAIYLLHLSDANSDAEGFKKQVEELTGVPVEVA